jgi:hypothetical protein
MVNNMKKLTIFLLLILVLLLAGSCSLFGIFASPTSHERTIPAEYNLAGIEKGQTVLVVVDSPDWSSVPLDLKQKLITSLNIGLRDKLKIKEKYILNFKNKTDQLAGHDRSSLMLPYNVGKKAGADFVLFVELYGYDAQKVTQTSYYKAEVSGRAALFDINNEQKLWPKNDRAKFIRVGFDIEQGGYNEVTKRLAASFTHCTVRYLYDCIAAQFKHFDDRTVTQLEQWDDMF